MSNRSVDRTLELNSVPQLPMLESDNISNYTIEQKRQNANEVIWICAAMTLFGLFFLGLPLHVVSLLTLASTPLRRFRPTRSGVVAGSFLGLANLTWITSSLYMYLGR